MKYAILIILIVLIAGPAHSGDIRMWRDENGKIYFGDTPPSGRESLTITNLEREHPAQLKNIAVSGESPQDQEAGRQDPSPSD